MALTIGALSYEGQQPAASGQVLVTGPSDANSVAYKGNFTVTLDGTSTSATVNFIDGTNGLYFTVNQSTSQEDVTQGNAVTAQAPSGILLTVSGGTQTGYLGVSATSLTATGFTLNLSAAGTSTKTAKISFVVLK